MKSLNRGQQFLKFVDIQNYSFFYKQKKAYFNAKKLAQIWEGGRDYYVKFLI
jgi:hypothetical protein